MFLDVYIFLRPFRYFVKYVFATVVRGRGFCRVDKKYFGFVQHSTQAFENLREVTDKIVREYSKLTDSSIIFQIWKAS